MLWLQNLWKVHSQFFAKVIPLFMNRAHELGETVGINTIHQCKYYLQTNKFKPVQLHIVLLIVKLALYALEDGRKFLKDVESDLWPAELSIIQKNMLCTTNLDAELDKNIGNDTTILLHLLDPFTPKNSARVEQYKQKRAANFYNERRIPIASTPMEMRTISQGSTVLQ